MIYGHFENKQFKQAIFLGTLLRVYEYMMTNKSDVFVLLRNERPCIDWRDTLSMIKHEDEDNGTRSKDKLVSEDFMTLKLQ